MALLISTGEDLANGPAKRRHIYMQGIENKSVSFSLANADSLTALRTITATCQAVGRSIDLTVRA
jgi:hypothetical protein